MKFREKFTEDMENAKKKARLQYIKTEITDEQERVQCPQGLSQQAKNTKM